MSVKLPRGYAVKHDNGAYQLAMRGQGAAATAPAWLVICVAHGTTAPARTAKDGDALGRSKGRAIWCEQCRRDAEAAS